MTWYVNRDGFGSCFYFCLSLMAIETPRLEVVCDEIKSDPATLLFHHVSDRGAKSATRR